MMRNIDNTYLVVILSLLCLLSSGCVVERPLEHIQQNVEISGFDLTKYSAMGFLYTPYRYDRDYKSIGILSLLATPEANLVDRTVDERRSDYGVPKKWKINKIRVELALDSLYQAAIHMGADAIVDLQIIGISESYKTTMDQIDYPVTLYGYKISGFAIKRQLLK